MVGRRLLYEFMIASPIVMLLAIAIEARLTEPAFEVYNYSPKSNQQLLSYRPFISEIQHIRNHAKRADIADRARSIGTRWLEARKKRQLEPFFMTNILDSSRDGIKGQIRINLDILIATLGSIAAGESEKNPGRAIQDLKIAAGLTQSIKYTDVDSIGYFAMRERSILRIVYQTAEHCNEQQLLELRALVNSISIDSEKLARTIQVADLHYVRDGERWSEERSPILDPLSRSSRFLGKGNFSAARKTALALLDMNMANHVNTISYSMTSLESEREYRDIVLKFIAEQLMRNRKSA